MNKPQEKISAIKSQAKREASIKKKQATEISEAERIQRIEADLKELARIANLQFELKRGPQELELRRQAMNDIVDVLRAGDYL